MRSVVVKVCLAGVGRQRPPVAQSSELNCVASRNSRIPRYQRERAAAILGTRSPSGFGQVRNLSSAGASCAGTVLNAQVRRRRSQHLAADLRGEVNCAPNCMRRSSGVSRRSPLQQLKRCATLLREFTRSSAVRGGWR